MDGMRAGFETVKKARSLLETITKSTANDKTKASYMSTTRAIFAGARTAESLIAAAMNTRKTSTWGARSAAMKYRTRDLIERLLQQQDQMQRALRSVAQDDPRWAQWGGVVRDIRVWATLLEALKKAEFPPEGRVRRHSKRQDMRGLPVDWRERIISRMPNYAPAALVAALTGCRPAELVMGVKLSIQDGELIAYIRGAKETEKTGQPWRKMCWPIDSTAPLVRAAIELLNEERVGGRIVQIQNARAFSGAVRSAGKREWPTRLASLTPYCFRHQAAADMKLAGTDSSDISAALGHCVDVTKSTYGHVGMGHAGGVAPSRVEAARPVRIKPLSKAATERAAAPARIKAMKQERAPR
jgi:integrase